LADGPVLASKVKAEAKRDGLSWRLVENVSADMGVIKKPPGFQGPFFWRLGTESADSATDSADSRRPDGPYTESAPSTPPADSADTADSGRIGPPESAESAVSTGGVTPAESDGTIDDNWWDE